MNDTANFLRSPRGIIVAADVDDLENLQRLIEEISGIPEIVAVKIGFSLGLRFGLPAVVKTMRESTALPVIYDHQKAGTDIPQMGRPFAEVCHDAGIDAVIFFPQAGPKTLQGFVTAAVEKSLTPIIGLVMSHPEYLQFEGGYIADDAPRRMAERALQLGVTAFVLPGTKPEIIRHYARGVLGGAQTAIMMPGIGSQGGSLRAACEATAPHRPFPIIGSAIYGAKCPRAAAASFTEELNR